MTRDKAMKILGLSQGYSVADLRKAYKRLVKKYHPDVTQGKTTELFLEVKKAYDLLSRERQKRRELVYTHASIFTIVVK